MSESGFLVEIEPPSKEGAIKAYAALRKQTDHGILVIHGFRIIQAEGKGLWVGFPQTSGNTHGKYFPIVKAEGKLRELMCRDILKAYDDWAAER